MQLKKTYISVGEPWNFNSLDGENIINGHVIRVVNDICLVFKANYNVSFLQYSGNILILFPRYTNEDFLKLGNIENNVPINGKVLIDTYNEFMTENELKENSIFVIIGSIVIL